MRDKKRIRKIKKIIIKLDKIYSELLYLDINNSDFMNKAQVWIEDENKLNNNVNNLEWCDNWYNTHYGTHYERVSKTSSKTFKNKYKNGFQPRKRAVIIVELNMIFPMIKDCAKYLNCSRTQVNDCAKGKYKTCRGYTIKYYE